MFFLKLTVALLSVLPTGLSLCLQQRPTSPTSLSTQFSIVECVLYSVGSWFFWHPLPSCPGLGWLLSGLHLQAGRQNLYVPFVDLYSRSSVGVRPAASSRRPLSRDPAHHCDLPSFLVPGSTELPAFRVFKHLKSRPVFSDLLSCWTRKGGQFLCHLGWSCSQCSQGPARAPRPHPHLAQR